MNERDSALHSAALVNDQPYMRCASPLNLSAPKLDMLLTVCEARDLKIRGGPTNDAAGGEERGVQLVVRTPWATEDGKREAPTAGAKVKRFSSAVIWRGGQSPAFHFGLRTTAHFDEASLTHQIIIFRRLVRYGLLMIANTGEIVMMSS